jgi:hypothetical protein
MHMKYGKSAVDLETALSYYDKANGIIESMVGNKSISFLLSMVDIAEVYTQQKKYDKALGFLNFAKGQVATYYGEHSIFMNRVNSCLIEVYSEIGGQKSALAYKLSMENVDLAMKQYGEESLFCLMYFMSGMSANVTNGTHNVAENILNKMLRTLESSGEIKNGNQFFFLASILLGVVCAHAGQHDQAHLFFTGTMKKQLAYVGDEVDHPFLEQTYQHMAMMYKQIGNLNSSLIMWEKLLKVQQRMFGENSYFLSNIHKNIGTCQIGTNFIDQAVVSLNKAKSLSKSRIDECEDPKEINEEKRELAEVYFALYLAYVAKADWDSALLANDQSMKNYIEVLGDNDFNVSNCYYLGAQMFLKKLCIDEALNYVRKANDIIDVKPIQEPLLLARYRFLRAKLFKNQEKNKESLSDLDDAIKAVEGNPKLYNDELEIKKFRKNVIATISEEQRKEFGIDMEKEKRNEDHDEKVKQQVIEQMKSSVLKESMKKQGIDPTKVDANEFANENEDEQEDDDLSTIGIIAALAGVAILGTGIYYTKYLLKTGS